MADDTVMSMFNSLSNVISFSGRRRSIKRWSLSTTPLFPLLICVCMGLSAGIFSPASTAQGLNASPQTTAAVETKPAVQEVEPTFLVVFKKFNEPNIYRMEQVIRLILMVCGVWVIYLSFRQKKGTFKLASPFFGTLLLIDAGTLPSQLNWWMHSTGTPYDPALGLAMPGLIGSVLLFVFVIVLRLDQRRIQRSIVLFIALCLLLASVSLSYAAWPGHAPPTSVAN